ncbi:GerAB/ArcD/ProY family transporter [Paenibacillus roseipurpureus]|uniref:Endospore germination permease n=1 Tax=Paenibacillus roseopurpureus TaxID=2918901 RepID=A0AA96LUM6_9BACL|nr:endospore germination permease [Paenibacillus sp. MBLB1832]WNR46796.1 endospore germination permease [Paenibacillus sp. MBLB1832]
MIEKGKISPQQMALIMHPTILSTAALIVPSITMRQAGSDMWISPILSSFVGYLTVYILYRLHTQFPSDTFVQYVPKILGKYVGLSISIMYLVAIFYSNSLTIREYGEFITGNFLNNTPMIIVVIAIISVCAYALYEGLEVIARSTQIMVPIAICIILLMVVTLIPDFHIKEMMPIFGNGLLPPILGSIVPASWYSQFFIISFLFPFLTKKDLGMKWSLFSVTVVLLTTLAINVPVLLTFGSLTTSFNYPFLVAVRYIALSDFIEHIESLLMAIWIMGIYIKISIIYYLVTIGTAQIFKLDDYRTLIIPMGFLIILGSIWVSPNFQEMNHALSTTIPFFALFMQVVVPALLLIVVMIKGRLKR